MNHDTSPPATAGVERVTVSLGTDQLSHLDQLGANWGLSRSAVVRLAIVKLLGDPAIFLGSVVNDSDQKGKYNQPPPEGEAA